MVKTKVDESKIVSEDELENEALENVHKSIESNEDEDAEGGETNEDEKDESEEVEESDGGDAPTGEEVEEGDAEKDESQEVEESNVLIKSKSEPSSEIKKIEAELDQIAKRKQQAQMETLEASARKLSLIEEAYEKSADELLNDKGLSVEASSVSSRERELMEALEAEKSKNLKFEKAKEAAAFKNKVKKAVFDDSRFKAVAAGGDFAFDMLYSKLESNDFENFEEEALLFSKTLLKLAGDISNTGKSQTGKKVVVGEVGGAASGLGSGSSTKAPTRKEASTEAEALNNVFANI